MDLKGMGWDGVDWINVVQDTNKRQALVNTVIILEYLNG
jgi:hypothetical protein